MADFNFYLNRQGPKGEKGDQGEKGDNGITPTFYAGTDTDTTYTLIIDSGNGNTFETSNLKVPTTNAGGTYLRYDQITGEQSYAPADVANLQGNIGEVKLATTTTVANETVQDSDAVSYELFRRSGGGGGGTSYSAGTGIDITNNAISIDSSTFNTIGSAVQPSDLGTLAFKDSVDYTIDVTNKPTLGSLASKDVVDYSADVTNKPTIGAGIITFTQGSTTLGTIDVNQTTPTTINIPSSGGGGGSTYAAGNGIDISVADVISTKVDNNTIGFTAGGELELKATIPNDTGDLTNGAGYITSSALSGYATEAWVRNQGYITGITSSDITTALGYTPYNSSNPNGYTNNIGTVTSVNNTNPDSNGNVTLSIPAAQVQADWNEIDGSSKAYILNKPTIPDTTNMVTTNATQTISGTKTFGAGNLKITDLRLSDDSKIIEDKGTYVYVGSGGITTKIKSNNTKLYFNGSSGIDEEIAKVSQLPGGMTGASASYAGASGLVPTPAAGDNEKFLRGDGTWQTVSGGGTATDVQINGISITSSDVANIVTEGVYNSSTNKIATMSDVPTNCVSGSEVSSPLEYTTSTIGVEKFNYTGNTGTVAYDGSAYGMSFNPPSNAFQYISELANGVNFISTFYTYPSSNSVDITQTGINLGTYSNGVFTPLLGLSWRYGSDFQLYDPDVGYYEQLSFTFNGTYNPSSDYTQLAENSKDLLLFSYDPVGDILKVGICYPMDANGGWNYLYKTVNNVSTGYPGYVTKLAQCTHIQVAFVNTVQASTINIENMVFTNPNLSYTTSDITTPSSIYDLSQLSTNLYTNSIDAHTLELNYDNNTLDVQNGALKVKDNTFITEASLETVHCVIKTYQDGTSWYRLYDDGWVEQGGITDYMNWVASGSSVNIVLLKSMSNTSYYRGATMLDYTGNWGAPGCCISSCTTSGITVSISTSGTNQGTARCSWYVAGYAAQT